RPPSTSVSLDVAPDDLVPLQDVARPSRVGAYAIESLRGTWPLGEVYRARQDRPRLVVTLKVLSRELARHRDVVGALVMAGVRAARLEVGGAARVLKAGEADGTAYVAVESVDGATVEALLA